MTGTPPPPPFGGDPTRQPPPPPYGTPPAYDAGYRNGYEQGYGAPGYGPGSPMPPYGGPPQPQSKPSGMAIASLVLGIIGVPMFCFVLPSLLAVVFGGVGLRQCSKNPVYSGKGMAIAGLVLGLLTLLGFVLLLVAFDSFDSDTWNVSE